MADTVTDANGNYLFESVQPGTYIVRWDLSSVTTDFRITTAKQGGDDALDSDSVSGAVGGFVYAMEIEVLGGTTHLGVDLGLVETLPAIKAAALDDLATVLATYLETDYTAENWTALNTAKTDGDLAINAATDPAGVATAKASALAAMDAVLTIAGTPTSTGIDLRAYQSAEGTVVEFVAYDVEGDGTIRLALMCADGAVVWQGDVAVAPAPRFFARFLVPGLELGGSYNFQVRDEVGKWWEANGVTVEAFATEMTSATLAGITLTFDSLTNREYEIQWTAALGGEWQTVTNVSATGAQTEVVVPHPDPEGLSGFFRVRLK